jgi:hypothetical protein
VKRTMTTIVAMAIIRENTRHLAVNSKIGFVRVRANTLNLTLAYCGLRCPKNPRKTIRISE